MQNVIRKRVRARGDRLWSDGRPLGNWSFFRSAQSTRSEEHTSELQSHLNLVCRLLLEKKKARAPASRQKAGAVRLPVLVRKLPASSVSKRWDYASTPGIIKPNVVLTRSGLAENDSAPT